MIDWILKPVSDLATTSKFLPPDSPLFPENSLCCYHQVTVMFMDIVDFTSMSKEVSPGEVMGFLNE